MHVKRAKRDSVSQHSSKYLCETSKKATTENTDKIAPVKSKRLAKQVGEHKRLAVSFALQKTSNKQTHTQLNETERNKRSIREADQRTINVATVIRSRRFSQHLLASSA